MRCEKCKYVFENGESYLIYDNDQAFCDEECFIDYHNLIKKKKGDEE